MSDTRAILKNRRLSDELRFNFASIGFSNVQSTMLGNIMSLTEGAIEKFKIALILPKILGNPLMLKQCVQNTRFAESYVIVKNYLIEQFKETIRQSQLASTDNSDETRSIHDKTKSKYDHHLRHLIEYFFDHTTILEVLPDWTSDLNEQEANELEALKTLCFIANIHFKRNVETAMKFENDMRSMYLENNFLIKNIEDIENKMDKKQRNMRWQSLAKDVIIKNVEMAVNQLQKTKYEILCTKITETNHLHREITQMHAQKQEELQDELTKAKTEQIQRNKENFMVMKSAREMRERILIQIKDLLKKRETSLLEKFKKKIALSSECAVEREKMKEFNLACEEVRQKHKKIVGKQMLESETFCELTRFRILHSIRSIQRWYRAIHAKAKQSHRNEQFRTKKVKKQTTKTKNALEKSTLKSKASREQPIKARISGVEQVKNVTETEPTQVQGSVRKTVAFRRSSY